MAETVYAAEWPGFPGETKGRCLFIADIEALDEAFHAPPDPDWLAITAVYEAEETAAFKEADESPIYDYEIEIQRPVPSREETKIEKVSWRQRAKRIMAKANEAVRGASITAFATAQAKLEGYYGDEEAGERRKKATKIVAGVLAVGASAYLGSRGLVSSNGSSHQHAAGALLDVKAPSGEHFGETVFEGASNFMATHHHVAHMAVEAQATVTVHPGDTPWSISEHHLMAGGNAHSGPVQIEAYDKAIARDNPGTYTYAGDSSQDIPVGTELNLPKIK